METETKTISLEPNWDGLRRWFEHVKRSSMADYRRMLAADTSGKTARWLGEQWPLPTLATMKRRAAKAVRS